jgi:hypothetical protein
MVLTVVGTLVVNVDTDVTVVDGMVTDAVDV